MRPLPPRPPTPAPPTTLAPARPAVLQLLGPILRQPAVSLAAKLELLAQQRPEMATLSCRVELFVQRAAWLALDK